MFGFFKKQNTDPKERLKQVIGEYELPTFPSAAMETLRVIRNPDSTSHQVADALSVDPGLSVRVLRLANSAAFSPNHHIENLGQAVAMVGLAQLEGLVLSAAARSAVPRPPHADFDLGAFWRAAVRRGVLAKDLAHRMHRGEDSLCFTAGILQDLAIPFLVQQHADYAAAVTESRTGGRMLCDIERESFGWDHAEVATWICAAWHLPEDLASAIGGHHDPDSQLYHCPAPVHAVAPLDDAPEETVASDKLDQVASSVRQLHLLPEDEIRPFIHQAFEHGDTLARLLA